MSDGILVAKLDDIAEGEGIAIDKARHGHRRQHRSAPGRGRQCLGPRRHLHPRGRLAGRRVGRGRPRRVSAALQQVLPEERRGSGAAGDEEHLSAPGRGPRRRCLAVSRTRRRDVDSDVVIVGGGVGGVSTAGALRAGGFAGHGHPGRCWRVPVRPTAAEQGLPGRQEGARGASRCSRPSGTTNRASSSQQRDSNSDRASGSASSSWPPASGSTQTASCSRPEVKRRGRRFPARTLDGVHVLRSAEDA